MNDDNNFFDNLNPIDREEAEKFNKDQEEKGKHIDYLIHKVFYQSEEGQELLEIWKDSLIFSPVVVEGEGIDRAGIREGMNRMIRNIILTINRVNKGDK